MSDPRFHEFIRLFNGELFFEAHEVLEDLWLETDGDQKLFYKGLIQCAVAFAHWQRNNMRGAKQVGARAIRILKEFGSQTEGIDLELLIQQSEAFLGSQLPNYPRIQTVID